MRKLRRKLSQALAVTLVASTLMPTGITASAAVGDRTAESVNVAGGSKRLEIGTGLERSKGEGKRELTDLTAKTDLEETETQDKLAEAARTATAHGSCGQSGTSDSSVTWSLEDHVLTISGQGKMMSTDVLSQYPWSSYRTTIRKIVIEDGVTSIGVYAFNGGTALKEVEIADSVGEIGSAAFAGCQNLVTLNLGNGVTTIGSAAFSQCTSLENVTIPDSVTDFGTNSRGVSGVFENCTGLKTVSIGAGMTSIPRQAFISCVSLEKVEIPDTVTTIDAWAFYGCEGLREVVIGDGVETIEGLAFYLCKNLTKVTLGIGVETIKESAFEYCYSLPDGDVYYAGYDEDWDAIDIEDPTKTNKPLIDARLHLKGQLEDLALNRTQVNLEEGEEFQLTVGKIPEDAEVDLADAIWSSSDETVAVVEGSGAEATVKALSAGTAEITVELGDVTAVCQVTVTEVPTVIELESLELDKSEMTLKEGEEFQLTVSKKPENADADLADVTWSSSDEAVAVVEGSGAQVKIKALTAGTAKITVKLGEAEAICQVTVTETSAVIELESLELDKSEMTLKEGEEFQLTVSKKPENADADLADAVWSSSDETVAVVEGSGAEAKVKALTAGTAEITVKLGEATAVCQVTVTEESVVIELESLELDKSEMTLKEGEEFQLTVSKIPENADADLADAVWSSSHEAVAVVEGSGAEAKVKALTAGTAEITVKLGEATAVCQVTVTEAGKQPAAVELESIQLSETERTLRAGGIFKLTVTMNPENAENVKLSDVKWSSSDEKVATVDQEGIVRAVAPGSAEITAELGGKTASCAVTVLKASGGSSSGGGSTSRSSSSASVVNTWMQDEYGWKYRKEDGAWAIGGWYQLSYNEILEWYYFNDQGYMSTGWITDQGRWYYLNPISDGTQGKMVTGWQQIDGKWYYFNEISDGTKGALMTNTQIGEYYVNEEGVRVE